MAAAWEQFYDGSRRFQFVAEATKMPIDQVNFILAQLCAVALSFVLRTRLQPLSAPEGDSKLWQQHRQQQRHKFALVSGLLLTYFCFGKQVLLAVALGAVCYLLLLTVPPVAVHRITLVVCMGLLSAAHLYRQTMQQATFVIDITGPLMLMVQRITTVAFGIHDGRTKEPEKMTAMQRKNAITTTPSMLEYFSYLLSFQSILAGPFLMFSDYRDYINGNDEYNKAVVQCKSVEQAQQRMQDRADVGVYSPAPPLNPAATAFKKLALGALYGISTVCVASYYPVTLLTGPSFHNSSMVHKLWLILLTTTLARHLYYTAWLLAEAACNMGGLGYSGLDQHGRHTWKGASNVDIMGVEFGTSFRIVLDSWNSKTVIWLRYAAYERLPSKYQVGGTYTLSSMWHGFYPGYYCTFFTASLMTMGSRAARRSVRPIVVGLQGGEEGWIMTGYHVLTWFMGRLILSYCTFSFVLLRFWPTLHVYWSVMFYMHIIGLLCIFVLPIIIPPPKRSKPKIGESVANGTEVSNNNNRSAAVSDLEKPIQKSTDELGTKTEWIEASQETLQAKDKKV